MSLVVAIKKGSGSSGDAKELKGAQARKAIGMAMTPCSAKAGDFPHHDVFVQAENLERKVLAGSQ